MSERWAAGRRSGPDSVPIARRRAEEDLPRIRKIRDRRGLHYVAAGSCVLALEQAEGAPYLEFLDAANGLRSRVWVSEVSAIEEAI